MNDLPRGTVTFLFTNIESSTKLWQQFPDAMPAALARSLDNDWLMGMVLFFQGHLFTRSSRNDQRNGREQYNAAPARFEQWGDYYWADVAAYQASITYFYEGDYVRARLGIERTLQISRAQKNRDMIALKLNTLGDIAQTEQDYALAKQYFTEAREVAQEIGMAGLASNANLRLGQIALRMGEPATARAIFFQGVESLKTQNDLQESVFHLLHFAALTASENKAAQWVELFGFADTFSQDPEFTILDSLDKAEFSYHLATARAQLSGQDFSAAWQQGRALTMEQAIELALREETDNG